MSEKVTPGVESARRALQILLMFGEDTLEVTLDDIVRAHGISQPSAYRYLSLLKELDLVQEGRRGGVVLTRRILTLAAAAEPSLDLERAAQPVLEDLAAATGETAFIQRRVKDEAHFVLSVQPDRALSLSFRAGNRLPLNRGAVAKVLLAYAPKTFRKDYLGRVEVDVSARQAFADELASILERGFAESEAEVDEGIWGGAVPITVGGELVAALSVAGPAFRFDHQKRKDIEALLRQGASTISGKLAADARSI